MRQAASVRVTDDVRTEAFGFLLCVSLTACGSGESGAGGGDTDATSSAGASTTGQDPGPQSSTDSSESGSADDSTTSGDTGMTGSESSGGQPPEPTQTDVCNGDGSCDPDETCSTCPDECGSCDVEDLPDQRAKYVDGSCSMMGDGSSDSCAMSPGGVGRFNALQPALDSLVAGDTLYVHPGDYWRSVPASDSGGVFVYGGPGGSQGQPVVITAADRNNPPALHSCNPDDPSDCPSAALTIGADHTIVDHLRIVGRVQVWGADQSVLQNLECTQGWGACGDGNWSCLRIEASTRCVAHHNLVHEIAGEGMGESCPPGQSSDAPDRGAGLKEFSSDATIWEFNTVDGAPYWAYDLHRNSVRTTLRFNDFRNVRGHGIRVERTNEVQAYGNQIVGQPSGAGGCIEILGQNEANPGEHVAMLHHNTCVRAQAGFTIFDVPTDLHDNVIADLRNVNERPRNVVVSVPQALDRNGYDAAGNFRFETYEPGTWYETLEAWGEAVSGEGSSASSLGGACSFSEAPGDGEGYDLRIEAGVCAEMGADGEQVGVYGVSSCVGFGCG